MVQLIPKKAPNAEEQQRRTKEARLQREKQRETELGTHEKAEIRARIQDWHIWLATPDKHGNSVTFELENLRVGEFQGGAAEGRAVYNRLKHKFQNPLKAPTLFFLQYKLPAEPYPINVEVSDGRQLFQAFHKFASLELLDYVGFGPTLVLHCREKAWTHLPPTPGRTAVARFTGRATLTRQVADGFTRGDIHLTELSDLMTLSLTRLKRAVHARMPAEQQMEHAYLLERARKVQLTPAEQYLAGEITLEAYEDIKFPHARERREQLQRSYPIPEEPAGACVVCKEAVALLCCMECSNRVCQRCVRDQCQSPRESFLLFHRVHCLKFGRRPLGKQPLGPVTQYRLGGGREGRLRPVSPGADRLLKEAVTLRREIQIRDRNAPF